MLRPRQAGAKTHSVESVCRRLRYHANDKVNALCVLQHASLSRDGYGRIVASMRRLCMQPCKQVLWGSIFTNTHTHTLPGPILACRGGYTIYRNIPSMPCAPRPLSGRGVRGIWNILHPSRETPIGSGSRKLEAPRGGWCKVPGAYFCSILDVASWFHSQHHEQRHRSCIESSTLGSTCWSLVLSQIFSKV